MNLARHQELRKLWLEQPSIDRTLNGQPSSDDTLGEQASVEESEAVSRKPSSETVAKPRVAKTVLEMAVPSFVESSTDQEDSSVSPPEVEEPDSGTVGKPRVSKTLLEAPMFDQLNVERVETEGRELLAELVTSAHPKDAERGQRFRGQNPVGWGRYS